MDTQEQHALYSGDDRVVFYRDFPKPQQSAFVFQSGFPCFDEKIGGIELGEVVVVTGHRKNGKTLFAESWLRSIMRRDPVAKTVIFSFEVQAVKLIQKYLGEDDVRVYLPLKLKTMDFDWLKDRCHEARDKFDCRLVLIDHLHFLVDMNTRQNMSLNIGAFMRRLKQEVALGLGMGVVLIAHQGQAKKGDEASSYAMRDSSFIGQEADSLVVVSRRKNFDDVELHDYENLNGIAKADLLREACMADPSDEFSAGLSVVSIDATRRTGVIEYKKLFRKNGKFLEEI